MWSLTDDVCTALLHDISVVFAGALYDIYFTPILLSMLLCRCFRFTCKCTVVVVACVSVTLPQVYVDRCCRCTYVVALGVYVSLLHVYLCRCCRFAYSMLLLQVYLQYVVAAGVPGSVSLYLISVIILLVACCHLEFCAKLCYNIRFSI